MTESKQKSKNLFIYFILLALILTGLILSGLAFRIYGKTVVSWIPFVLLWVGLGVVLTPITTSFLRRHFDSTNWISSICFNAMSVGGIAVYSVLAVNSHFSKGDVRTLHLPVLSSGKYPDGLKSCGKYYVNVRLDGAIKELQFPCGEGSSEYKFVDVKVRRGVLGWMVVDEVQH